MRGRDNSRIFYRTGTAFFLAGLLTIGYFLFVAVAVGVMTSIFSP